MKLLTLLPLFGGVLLAAERCENLARLALPAVAITRAESVPAGTRADRPAYCRVAGVLKPSADSDIQFEVWLPAAGWNGKFWGVGNGGFAGSINLMDMGKALARGYATASTDTGHQGGGTDAAWALGHPEKVADFAYRAIHETAVTAKVLIEAFYGQPAKRAYFHSCSNGGRQALMEAQRYPEDYDGIVAGAPANYWTHLLANGAANLLALHSGYIPASKLAAIQAAGLAACDAQDGVKDQLIGDPPRCKPDLSKLLCQGAETDACLTAPQIATLKTLYGGSTVFPGYPLGGEAESGGWGPWITGRAPETSGMFAFATQFFKYMVFENAAWDYRTFVLDRDTAAADAKLARILNATDANLARFRARGGKLILYHGWSDAAISACNTINYYQAVQKKTPGAGGFVRLFLMPGVQHCAGGSGPSQADWESAIERWVEQGAAPERLLASTRGGTVQRTRPLCPYPQAAHYKGSGSIDDAASFSCR